MAEETLIGERIKQRRKALGLSLRDVAKRVDVSASFLSQLERGQSGVTIDTLRRIAGALNVPIFHFLSAASAAPSQADCLSQPVVIRADYRPRLSLSDSRVIYELLTPNLSCKMEAIRGRLAPGTGNVARPLGEPTEEVIYVLSGTLLITLDSEDYILHPGDSVYFEGAQLQKLECASVHEDAIWLSVITPPVF